ncbi:MAG: NAD(P)/FAD-dependent oxidoreductase [Planctomycetota bacterium]
MSAPAEKHVVIGAGPAGLTAAWHLVRAGQPVLLLEAEDEHVGGLARTHRWDELRYDIGPHRFYTKSPAVQRMWAEMLPSGYVTVERLTRIYYERRFYPYPLKIGETLRNFGALRALRAGASFVGSRLRPRAPEVSFEDWAVNRFGRTLYEAFFRTYTEKVWGVPCAEIHKDWAAQRIRGLSLLELVRNALPGLRREVKSLVERFDYPPLGAGQVWETVRDEVRARGGEVRLGARVVKLRHAGGALVEALTADGARHTGSHFHLTLTLKDFVEALDPAPPPEILAAGRGLRHRDFMTVALSVPKAGLFPDQWIYVHDPGAGVARITNYANWAPGLSPGDRTVLGMEYFCTRGTPPWSLPDDEVVALASRELHAIGLSPDPAPRPGRVHRLLDAYPVYDGDYRAHRETLKAWIAGALRNAYPAGRKGLHNYNSQDHAMMSATLNVRNALEGTHFDPWAVNTEQEYAEEGEAAREIEERLVPRRVR